ncbi:alkyl hydroperoxide reductase subunit F [Sinobacterium caligoides]|uniref:Alkyl hydroperoxide reductase subunit F n=1 Tax=Sinobacterium caligoides TaxID=933926 RepID=A0A3N2DN29_9GAMM|nr:alkyl hydroperoxide reductase subunit F [Sinobacterium caligoides]ROS01214.1 alkyl hydroperoxide reductase subunit F [Sinobacterium caligoides]
MLTAAMKEQLKTYLNNLQSDVELLAFTDDGPKSKELNTLVNDIATLSDKVQVKDEARIDERVPSMIVRSATTGTEIRFAGLPMGHEFTSLVLALLHSGGHPMKVEPELIEQVRNLSGNYRFETFVSLSCQNCPDVVQALNMMAAINPQITNVMIDGSLFQEEVFSHDIQSVPTVLLNGQPFAQGRISLQQILNKIDSGAEQRQAEALADKAPYDVLVVGGGAAGASAAIYAARKGVRTGIVADRFGGQMLDTVGIENFISVKATEGAKLVANLEEHVRDYDVDIITDQLANDITEATEEGEMVTVELASGATLYSRSVIVATGARWRKMNVKGESAYLNHGVHFCHHCDGNFYTGKKVAVIGGGNSGIEAAIDLAAITEHVTVLEFADTLRADEVLQQRANDTANLTIIKMALTTEVIGDGKKMNGLRYEDRNSGEQHQLNVDGVFVQIGLQPNSEFLVDKIERNGRQEIITDKKGATSMTGVFAAGDVTDSPYKQIIIAMGSGSTAALTATDYLVRFPASKKEVQTEAA